jgi:hypothetical protein
MGFILEEQGWFNICKSMVMHHTNRRRGENCMLISIVAVKEFDKIHSIFMTKILTRI